ncbi:MAG: alpha/beta hydrolase [Pseudomonadota bacterium]
MPNLVPEFALDALKPPSAPLLPVDVGRAMVEASAFPATRPFLSLAPDGDGHPVLVCPPFLASDVSTSFLRQYLRTKNYYVYRWKLGRNLGPQILGPDQVKLRDRIVEIYEKTHRRVSLIGWSLGGVLARELAKQHPDMVRQVITLGSPIGGKMSGVSSNLRKFFSYVSGTPDDGEALSDIVAQLHVPPEGVPSTAIFSRTDGVVSWRNCIEYPADFTDNIEIYGSHCGLGLNPSAYFAIADRLALPEEEWSPFDRTATLWRRTVFPSSGHRYK